MTDELRQAGLLDEQNAARFCRDGHFVYESGDHGDLWLTLDLLYTNPRHLQRLAARLAEKLRPYSPEVVCGPLLGGAQLGQWIAHELNAAFVYAAPQPEAMTAGGGYRVPDALRPLLRGRRAVIVDDAINAGAATRPCVRDIEQCGGGVAAVAALVVRTPGAIAIIAKLGLPVEYLAGLHWNTWPAPQCPLCRSRVPLDALT